jgi:photosystem II stability/assembly factor-like uncharacterized protein
MRKILLVLLVLIPGLITLAQPSYNWVQKTLSPGNNLQDMATMEDGSQVIVGYNNTVLKSTDNGDNWSTVNLVDGVFDFSMLSMNSAGVGMLVTGDMKIVNFKTGEDVTVDGKLLKTNDFGVTWTAMDLSGIGAGETTLDPNRVGAYSLDMTAVECIDENNAFLYCSWKDYTSGSKESFGAVFETKNGGTSWEPISDDLGNSVITAIQTVGSSTYVAGNNTLFKKVGEAVTDLYPNLVTADGGTDQTIFIFDIDMVSETEFYIATSSNGLFHTTDGGATITELAGTGVPSGGNDIKVIDANTIIVLGTSAKSKVTVDGGATWVGCYPGASCWEIAGVLNDSVVATAKDDIYKIAVSDLAANPTKWKAQNITDLGENIQQLHIIDADKAILAGYYEILKSTSDKGITWTDVTLPELYPIPGGDDAEYEIDFKGLCTSDGVSYAGTRRFYFINYPTDSSQLDMYFPGMIFKSTDNWETFNLVNLFDVGKKYVSDPAKNPFHDNCYGFEPYTIENVTDSILFFWAQWNDTTTSYATKVTHSYVFRSTDNGANWDIITEDFGNSFVTDIHFVDKDNGFVAGNKILLKTSDGGDTWTNLYETLDPGTTASMFIQAVVYESADEIYLPTTSDKVWKTTDGGATFTEIPGLSGATDFLKLSDTHWLSLGSATKSFVTWNGGDNWEACTPGTSIWNIVGIVNDSVWTLTKGDIYKISVNELLQKGVGVPQIITENNAIKILNRSAEIEVISSLKNIDRCVIYSITGNLLEVKEPKAESCVFSKSVYPSGIYIISTFTGNERYTNKVVF